MGLPLFCPKAAYWVHQEALQNQPQKADEDLEYWGWLIVDLPFGLAFWIL